MIFASCISVPVYGNSNRAHAELHTAEETLLSEEANSFPEDSWANVNEYNFTYEFFKMIGALGIIVVALLAFSFVFKKVIHSRSAMLNNTSSIKILERRSLSPKFSIYLIDVAGTTIIVGESPSGLQRLGELPQKTSIADEWEKS